MLDHSEIETSRAIQRRTGSTFHVATRFLPRRVRHETYVLYAMFRLADEVVDGERARARSTESKARELDRLYEAAIGARDPDTAVLHAFRTVADEHEIPDEEVQAFFDAMRTDVHKRRYETYGELEEYTRGSAAAVGVMMTAIMEPDDAERARPHAIALGEAFQLTNFLRDVREDVEQLDRIYIPQSTLRRHGVDEAQIESYRYTESFAAAIRAELGRAERRYRTGVEGIHLLPEDCQFPVLLAAVLYADYHRAIRAVDCDVLTNEPSLSIRRTVSLVCRTRLRWQFNRDPLAVFRQVSSISLSGGPPTTAEPGETMPAR